MRKVTMLIEFEGKRKWYQAITQRSIVFYAFMLEGIGAKIISYSEK